VCATTKYVSWSWKSSGGDATITPGDPAEQEQVEEPDATTASRSGT
jgi:hypothetical protein